MKRWGFRAGARRGRVGVRVLIVAMLAGALAALAVNAEAGTSTPQMASVQRAADAPIGARDLGAPAASSTQTGYVVLKPRDEQALKSFITAIDTPHSATYHQFLQAGQFQSRFGPTSATVDAVRSQLASDGLKVTSVARDGLMIGFSGTTANVETAFGTKLERYTSAAGITGEQTTKAVSLPSNIASDVTAVIGLNTLVHPEDDLTHAPKSAYAGHAAAKTGTVNHYAGAADPCSDATSDASEYGGLTDDQIANAYGATYLYSQGDTGQGVNIGVYELEPYSSSDLQTFDQCYFGSDSTPGGITNIAVDGGQPTGPGSGEAILDVEDVSAMAPGAHIDVYEAPNSTAGSLDDYAQMVNDDTDQIITSSWGFCEQDIQMADPGAQEAENYIFEQAAAQGQTVLNAAGDTGDDTCNEVRDVPPPSDQNPLSVGDPASQPYVLGVGGTTIQDADPSHYDETVWNDGAEWGGGGGGISESWAAPSWQQSLSYFSGAGYSSDLAAANGVENSAASEGISDANLTPGFCTNSGAADLAAGTTCRGVPDVAAQADEFTGAVTIYMDSQDGWITYGGTSSATPIWAGMLALVDSSSYCPSGRPRPRIGFASPLLYAIAENSAEYAASFHDITSGNNDVFGFDDGAVFTAGTGYDLATGLGSPILAGPDGEPGLASYLCGMAASSSAKPTITSLSSSSGPIAGGTPVIATGTHLGSVTSVTVGGAPATEVTVLSDTEVSFMLPAGNAALAPGGVSNEDPATGVSYTTAGSTGTQDGAGPANVEVTTSDGLSNTPSPASLYSYVDENGSSDPVPSVSSISPYAGAQTGGTITVYGSGFETDGSPSVTAVTVGGVAATDVTVENNWTLTATAPAYDDGTTDCVTASDLTAETVALGDDAGAGDSDPGADNICQTSVVVSNTNGPSATTDPPLPSYLGTLPPTSQDGLLEVPNDDCEGLTGVACEVTPQPTEYDYVPAPTITGVTALSTVDGDANADPSSYGEPTELEITGTGLNYQTLDWLSFGDPTDADDQDTYYPQYADGTTLILDAPASPSVAAGNDPGTGVEYAPVVAFSLGGESAYDSNCSSNDCVTYAGIPEIDSVTSNSNADGIGTSPDTGGEQVTIDGEGLSDVVPPLEFVDAVAPSLGTTPFSIGTQYSFTPTDSSITTETVAQNPALVDTYACSDSGCYPNTDEEVANEDELLLYPPGDPVITSVEDASGPALGGTLVTINGENLGCATSVQFGNTVTESLSWTQALLDCGATSSLTVVAPPGVAGESVPIKVTTLESDALGRSAATSPTEFSYDTQNPSVTSSVSYGSVNLSQSGSGTVTISNPASATQPLYPGGETDSNPANLTGNDAGDFSITNDGCSGQTLDPGQSCTIQVRFAPTALGSRTATLDIPWNESTSVVDGTTYAGAGASDFTVSLSGTGAEPTVTNTVTTPGASTTTTVTKTLTKTVTCTITVKSEWVTVKVHGKKKREYKKVTTRSKGCPKTAKKAAKPKKKSGKKDKKRKAAHGKSARHSAARG